MNQDKSEQMALLKFSVIAPAVNQTHGDGTKMAYFRKMAAESYLLPNGRLVQYSVSTIRDWYRLYKLDGLDALRGHARRDRGQSRVLLDGQKDRIDKYRQDFPLISSSMVYKKLIQEGLLLRQEVSLSTVQRYVHNYPKGRMQTTPEQDAERTVQRLAYEMEFANDCWQADTCYLPKITVDGSLQRTYLITILDDASRMPVHSETFLADNAVNFQTCLRKAIAKFGIPKRLYVDNGSPYKNEQLSLISASLGIILIHAKVRQPQGKGKCERFFRTIQQGWVYGQDFSQFATLAALNEAMQGWLQHSYLNQVHSSLGGMTPRERFLRDMERAKRIAPELLETHFLHRVERRVATDSTIRLERNVFEVPHRLIGQKIKVRYLPTDMKTAYVFDGEGRCQGQINPVRKVDNSKIKRRTPIDYSMMEVKPNV